LLLILTLPQLNPRMTDAVVKAIHARETEPIPRGGKFLDVSVDLSGYAEHDCPAISYFRIAVRDQAWVRKLCIAAGDAIEAGAPIAYLSTEPNEPLDCEPERPARVSVAGILFQGEWL
jgi:hypothetical protein